MGALEVPLLARVGYPGGTPFGTGWVPWRYPFCHGLGALEHRLVALVAVLGPLGNRLVYVLGKSET